METVEERIGMETMEEHIGELETQLHEWGEKLDELAAKVDAAAEAKLEYHKGIDDLKVQYRLAQAKLDGLRTAESAEEWEAVNAGVESTWRELEAAFSNLAGF